MSLDFELLIETKYDDNISRCACLDFNITHNLIPMWEKAGIYEALYMSSGLRANIISSDLIFGYMDMITKPSEYKKLNPENGWGSYEDAVKWLQDVIFTCTQYPYAVIRICK